MAFFQRVSTVGLAACLLAGHLSAQSGGDDPAKQRYELGKREMASGSFSEALRDLDEAAGVQFAKSPWAGEALALKAEYLLEQERDLAKARKDLDRMKEYPNVQPAAYLLSGRITLADSRSKASLEAAKGDFYRAYFLFPASAYVPEGRFREAEALRLSGQLDEAIEGYQTLALSYPRSVWTARALIQLAMSLTARGRWQEAQSSLQRVRLDFRNNSEAQRERQTALDLNTILTRLYIRRPPEQQAFRPVARRIFAASVRFEEVEAMAVSSADTVAISDKTGVVLVDKDGEVLPAVRAQRPLGVAFRRPSETYVVPFKAENQPLFIAAKSLSTSGTGTGALLKIPDPPDKTKILDGAMSLVQNWRREWLVGDVDGKSVWVFSDKGEFLRNFLAASAGITPHRMVINGVDEIAILDRDRKVIMIVDREGKPVQRIDLNAVETKLDRPADIAFDAFGHLYVLDRGKGQVVVLAFHGAARPKIQTTLVSPADKATGAFRKAETFTVDGKGRMFIFDDDTKQVQVYQ
jgi:outer membrane protein assembly factor BamD (BamD/ComL family)